MIDEDINEHVWETDLRKRLDPLAEPLKDKVKIAALPEIAFGLTERQKFRESIIISFPSSTGGDYQDGKPYQDEIRKLILLIRLEQRSFRTTRAKATITAVTQLIKSWFLGYKLTAPATTGLKFERYDLTELDNTQGVWEAELEFSFSSRIHRRDPKPRVFPEILEILFKGDNDEVIAKVEDR
jgi:hypothetical protein